MNRTTRYLLLCGVVVTVVNVRVLGDEPKAESGKTFSGGQQFLGTPE